MNPYIRHLPKPARPKWERRALTTIASYAVIGMIILAVVAAIYRTQHP